MLSHFANALFCLHKDTSCRSHVTARQYFRVVCEQHHPRPIFTYSQWVQDPGGRLGSRCWLVDMSLLKAETLIFRLALTVSRPKLDTTAMFLINETLASCLAFVARPAAHCFAPHRDPDLNQATAEYTRSHIPTSNRTVTGRLP